MPTVLARIPPFIDGSQGVKKKISVTDFIQEHPIALETHMRMGYKGKLVPLSLTLCPNPHFGVWLPILITILMSIRSSKSNDICFRRLALPRSNEMREKLAGFANEVHTSSTGLIPLCPYSPIYTKYQRNTNDSMYLQWHCLNACCFKKGAGAWLFAKSHMPW